MSTVQLENPKELGGVFLLLEEQFNEIRYGEFMEDVLAKLEEAHGQYFEAAAAPDGTAWAPLAPSTIAAKGHATILVEKDEMRRSVAMRTADSIRDVIEQPGYGAAVFGTSDDKAARHMTGTANMPARPFVGMNEPQVDALAEQAADEIVAQLIKE